MYLMPGQRRRDSWPFCWDPEEEEEEGPEEEDEEEEVEGEG